MAHSDPDLWTCPKCGEKFTGKRMWHSCGKFSPEALFANARPVVPETYQTLEAMAKEVAPFHIVPQKTRVCFQLRTRCACAMPYRSYLRFAFLSRRIIDHPRIVRVETYAPDQDCHHVKLASPNEVDSQIREWLAVSTEYGEQRNRCR